MKFYADTFSFDGKFEIVLDVNSLGVGVNCSHETQVGYGRDGTEFVPVDWTAHLEDIKKAAKSLVDVEFGRNLEKIMDNPGERKEQVWGLEKDWAWGYLTNHHLKDVYADHLDATRDGITDKNLTIADIAMKVVINDQIFRHTAAVATGHRRNVEKRIEAAADYFAVIQIIADERTNADATFAQIAARIKAFAVGLLAKMQAAIAAANA